MALAINTNLLSLNSQRNLDRSQNGLSTALARLSSGLRINSAKDDAAGLAISERFTSQVRGLNQAVRNANDGISLAQTAEGALSETTNNLQRIRELAVQASNATNSATDRQALQSEVNQLKTEIQRVASQTTFNGLKVLDGSFSAQNFQIGTEAGQTISVSINGAGTGDLANYSVSAASATTANKGTGSTAAAASALPAANTIATQTLTISGSQGSKTVSVTGGDSAKTVATSINAESGSTGVTATATTTATLSGLSAAGTVTLTLGSGGSTSTISAAVTTGDLSALSDKINTVTGTTDITATVSGGTLTLTQADGKNVEIADFAVSGTAGKTVAFKGADGATTTLTDAGTDSSIAAGTVTLNSSATFTASSSVTEALGSVFSTAAADSINTASKSDLASVDISSVTGASNALAVIDAALQSVSGSRADLGAVQNRFDSVIAVLSAGSQNASAARSRIQDADFAKETAALTRSQILQQAGIAILAQANAAPQQVLALLR